MSARRPRPEPATGPLLGPDLLVQVPAHRTLGDDFRSDADEPIERDEAAYPEQPGRIRRLIDRLLRRT